MTACPNLETKQPPPKQPQQVLTNFSLTEQFQEKTQWKLHAKKAFNQNDNYQLNDISIDIPLKNNQLNLKTITGTLNNKQLIFPQPIYWKIQPHITGEMAGLSWHKSQQIFKATQSYLKTPSFQIKGKSLTLEYPYKQLKFNNSEAQFYY